MSAYLKGSLLPGLAALLGGCALEPPATGADPVRARTAAMDLPSASQQPRRDGVAETAARWWTSLDDPVLAGLIDRALEDGFEVRLAATRFRAAEARLAGARAGLLPQLDARVSVDATQGGRGDDAGRGDETAVSAGLQARWQVDLFGALRNSVAAAEARAGSRAALQRDVERLLVRDVARAYITYRTLQGRRRLSEDSIARLEAALSRIDRLREAGYASRFDAARSRRQLHEQRAEARALETAAREAVNALAVLIAMGPGELSRRLEGDAELPARPPAAPLPDLARLIAHRPDLRAANAGLEAAAFEVAASRGGLYPSLDIRLDLNATRTAVDGLDPVLAGLVSQLAAPLLGRGRRLAAVDGASARLDTARVAYERAALNVITELDSARARLSGTRKVLAERAAARDAAETSLALSRRLFEVGETGYLDVLIAERDLTGAETAWLTARRDALQAWIDYTAAIAPAW